MNSRPTRRQFLHQTVFGSAGFWLAGGLVAAESGAPSVSPNDKLNIGMVGTANQAGWNLNNVASQNIVALCDVDDNYLAAAAKRFPAAKTYNDFRRLVEQKDIDAIIVATPDHVHAVATMAALQTGRHVYCEKPLTRTISECRRVRETARKLKRVTQLGTQIHAGNNYRRVVELVQSGAIGPVDEVHVWCSASYGGRERPTDTPPVPPNLHWDLWLGPVEERPYSPQYAPFHWRNWWAFGGGSVADFGCHYMDLPHWALDLREPLSAEAVDGPPVHPESTPPWLIVRYEYPARGEKPPVKLTWYHGSKKPALLAQLLDNEQRQTWGSGVLFLGKKGMLMAGYDKRLLLPEKDFANFTPPQPFIPNSIGHHLEWLQACKNGGPTTCNFDYSGALTEAVLLGNVAYRVGKKIAWDPKALQAKNCPEATQYIQHHYRPGWKLG